MTLDPAEGGRFVRVERRESVAILTLDRPRVRNAINDAMRADLRAALAAAHADDHVRAIVITGAGSAFCAGGDVKAMQARLASGPGRVAFDGWQRQRGTARLAAEIAESDRITIAAVNGPAAGLGFDLALACDFIVASPTATFSAAFVKRGLVPDGGGMYFLPRRIGMQRTKELIYSGRTVGIDEAQPLGLIDRLADDALLDEALAYAEQFTGNSRAAIALMKSIVSRSFETPLDRVAALGGQAQAIAYTTDDHKRAVEAFTAKSS